MEKRFRIGYNTVMNTNDMRKPELLMPAGDRETLETAVLYGADAVYLGGTSFSLRAKADNFTPEEMASAVSFAHSHNVKVYVTANILAHDADLTGAPQFLEGLSRIKPDGILTADPGIFRLAGRYCPDIDLHISTQANNTNAETVLFWKELGAKRIVLARELSLEEIKQIRQKIPREDMELEVFVHGAMCMSYSGRCLLSNYMTGRDANRGLCSHPCRWKYALVEETRPGVYIPVEEDEYGTAIMSSEDLCMAGHVDKLIEAGVDSLKIEGRMKTALYTATTARVYRRAIDCAWSDMTEGTSLYPGFLEEAERELSLCTHRPYGTGFFFDKPHTSLKAGDPGYCRGAVYLGRVLEQRDVSSIVIEQYNKFSTGDEIEILKPCGDNIRAAVRCIRDEKTGEPQDSAPHPRQKLIVELEPVSDEKSPDKDNVTDLNGSSLTGCVIRETSVLPA